jgi:hypothetical protein
MEITSPELFEREDKQYAKDNLAKRQPWTNYKLLVQKGNITFREIKDRIIESSKINFEYATIAAIIYLTASRLKEILDYEYFGKYYMKFPKIRKPGIRIMDIEEKEEDDETWVYFTTRNEKQNSKRGDITEYEKGITLEERYKLLLSENTKTVKLLFEEGCPDYELLLLIKQYILGLATIREMDEGDEIFPKVSRAQMSRFINKTLKISPHVLRHLRMVHLRKVYGLDIADLKEYGGWKSADMPLRYSKSNAQQIGQRFLEHINELKKKWEPFQNTN